MTDRSRCDAGSRMEPNTEDLQAELSDEHWLLITDLFANPKPSPQGGRPMADPRACFEGVLWMLRSGARWKNLPSRFPSRSTVHRRFVEWVGEGTLDRAWKRLMRLLDGEAKIDWREGLVQFPHQPSAALFDRQALQFSTAIYRGEFPIPVPQPNGDSTIEFRSFGTELHLVAFTLGQGRNLLQLQPCISEIDSDHSVVVGESTVPGLRVREVDTGVEMSTGHTFVVAGLLQERNVHKTIERLVNADNDHQPETAPKKTPEGDTRPNSMATEVVELIVTARAEILNDF